MLNWLNLFYFVNTHSAKSSKNVKNYLDLSKNDLDINLGEHFLLMTFCANFNFQNTFINVLFLGYFTTYSWNIDIIDFTELKKNWWCALCISNSKKVRAKWTERSFFFWAPWYVSFTSSTALEKQYYYLSALLANTFL